MEARNLLYQVKKKAETRSSPLYNPLDPDLDVRQELKQLRNKNRLQQTEIIRLKGQVKQLRDKILFYQQQVKESGDQQESQTSKMINQMSSIPMLIQNKQIKAEMSHTHEVNLCLNAKNRELQAKNRQLDSDLNRSKTKLKQLEILQKVRSQNFQKQVQNSKPVIVEDNSNYQVLCESLKKIIQFMRGKAISISYEIFLSSAKECQNQKKVNSYNIFMNYWSQLLKSKHLGYLSLLQCLRSLRQVQRFLSYDKDETYDINCSKYRDTLNEWLIETLTEIKHMKCTSVKMREQKLFRLLGLLYRSQFPMKGQKFQMDEDVKRHFQELLFGQIFLLLTT